MPKQIKISIYISGALIGLYVGLFFALMRTKIPAWKDGHIEATCVVYWGKLRPVVVDGRTLAVRKWSIFNAIFLPAEKFFNKVTGNDALLERMRSNGGLSVY